jgi:hypothetical protein
MAAFLRLRPGSRLAYLLALLVGAAIAAMVFPRSALLPSLATEVPRPLDPMQHIIGQRYFFTSPWGWPLLEVPKLAAPAGTNIALTDSIPLFALLLKLIAAELPRGFHGIYLWLALCWILQPVAAVFALRSAGERRLLPALCVAVIAGSMPTLLFRLQHAALSGHFLILIALGLYFRLRHGSEAALVAAPALLVASLLIHPYLLLMVAAILAAAPLSLLAAGWRHCRPSAAAVGSGLVLTGWLAWLLGYIGTSPPDGFGFYSMNLVAPFYPSGSALLPWVGALPDATGGQYEGYQYLGAGLLLLVLLAMADWRGLPGLLWRHVWLLIALVVLTCLALSNEVFLGHHLLLHIRSVPNILQSFQASGRLFWPVAYAILLAAVMLVARMRRIGAVALVVAAGLQFADGAALRRSDRLLLARPAPWAVDPAQLRPLLAAADRLIIWPPFGCGPDSGVNAVVLQTLLLGSEQGIETNTMYTARSRGATSCDASGVASTPLAPHELLVLVPPIGIGGALSVPNGGRECRRIDPLLACTRDAAGLANLPPLRPAEFPIDQVMQPASPQFAAVEGLGWTPVGPEGVWTEGHSATLAGLLPPGAVTLTLRGHALAARPGGTFHLIVMLDDTKVASWMLDDGVPTELHAALPARSDTAKPARIRLVMETVTRPIDRGMNGDTRELGFFMSGFRLDAAP